MNPVCLRPQKNLMDRNSVIGIILIGVLIIGYSIFTQPSAEERAAVKHQQDSIVAVMKAEEQKKAIVPQQKIALADSSSTSLNDSAKQEIL